MSFELKILGSSSATPMLDRHHSAQLLNIQQTHLLIDCGEATQLQLIRYKVRFQKIDYIFISHLHGDHYLGLVGLLSTMHLNGRTRELVVFGPTGLDEIITIQLRYSNTILGYPIRFQVLNNPESELILETESFTVETLPLNHRIVCNGFLIKEKPFQRRINKETLPEDVSLQNIVALKEGKDLLDDDGNVVIKNADVTLPPRKHGSYAYCSDTAYHEPLIEKISGVDLLYHESTFDEEFRGRAIMTYHSTASDAATIAKKANVKRLVIGHFSSRYKELDNLLKEARDIFPDTILGTEGTTLSVVNEVES